MTPRAAVDIATASGVRGPLPPPQLCWDLKPGTAARHCTQAADHDGPHTHEYSGATWPQ